MQINTKFCVGDIVYVCKNNSTYEIETCNTCDGIGVVTIRDKTFCCPACCGQKKTYTKFVKRFVPEKRTITKAIISISSDTCQPHIKYQTMNRKKSKNNVAEYRNIIFDTLEEAETRCKELNEEKDE